MWRRSGGYARSAWVLIVVLVGSLMTMTPGAASAQGREQPPGADGASTPVLLAAADCTDDGRTAELLQFEVRNVGTVDRVVEVVFDGDVIARSEVGAGESYRDRVPVVASWDDLALSARYVGAPAEAASVPMLVRPTRCSIRTVGPSLSARVNGPAGVAGLVCLDGVLQVAFDMENVDDVTRSMSVNVYSEGRHSVNDVEIVPRRPVAAGGRLHGAVPYPFGEPGFPVGHDGDTLIRVWFRDVADPSMQHAYHARVWYPETPGCPSPFYGRVGAAARLVIGPGDPTGEVRVVGASPAAPPATYR